MPPSAPSPHSVDAYIASFPPDVQGILQAVRDTVRAEVPDAVERISYRMPAYFQHGVVVYFAAFAQHIGMYPPVRDEALRADLAPYAGPKGNLRFPLSEPMPHALIRRVVRARAAENRVARHARAVP